MKINKAGLDLIKYYESFRENAYPDPCSANGLPITIGYGTTRINGGPVLMGMKCTLQQAEKWLLDEVAGFEIIVSAMVTVPLTENQFSALVSLVYNVGPGGKGIRDGIRYLSSGKPSTLLRLLNTGSYNLAANEFLKWNSAGGKPVVLGLTRRRTSEKDLFLTN